MGVWFDGKSGIHKDYISPDGVMPTSASPRGWQACSQEYLFNMTLAVTKLIIHLCSTPLTVLVPPKTKMIEASRTWVCRVVSSGYHNGSRCRPSDPHLNGWDCGYYYVGMISCES